MAISFEYGMHSGVYFLYEKGELIYIGKSMNLLSRIGAHDGGFWYDHVEIFLAPEKLISRLESLFISLFNPKENTQGNVRIPACSFQAKVDTIILDFERAVKERMITSWNRTNSHDEQERKADILQRLSALQKTAADQPPGKIADEIIYIAKTVNHLPNVEFSLKTLNRYDHAEVRDEKCDVHNRDLRFLTIRKAASLFGIPEHFLRSLVKNERAPGFYSGNRFMIDCVRLKQALNNGEL